MTSRETLECRIYTAEDAMYRQSDELNRRLHEMETGLKGLADSVHRLLCEPGPTPLEVRAGAIVQAVEDFDASTELSEIKAEGERVATAKNLIEGFEREIADTTSALAINSAEGRRVLELVATAS
jgi:hypothetical protein